MDPWEQKIVADFLAKKSAELGQRTTPTGPYTQPLRTSGTGLPLPAGVRVAVQEPPRPTTGGKTLPPGFGAKVNGFSHQEEESGYPEEVAPLTEQSSMGGQSPAHQKSAIALADDSAFAYPDESLHATGEDAYDAALKETLHSQASVIASSASRPERKVVMVDDPNLLPSAPFAPRRRAKLSDASMKELDRFRTRDDPPNLSLSTLKKRQSRAIQQHNMAVLLAYWTRHKGPVDTRVPLEWKSDVPDHATRLPRAFPK